MQCGAKCFLVEVELANVKKRITVLARSPITARKKLRKQYGTSLDIISVIRKK